MAQKPDMLLLDEPESGVDVENIALVGRAANYILHNEPCGGTGCDKPCCAHNLDCDTYNPLSSQRSGLIITHVGQYFEVCAGFACSYFVSGHFKLYSGDPLDVLSCISKTGYEKCVNGGCRRGMK